MNDIFQFGIQGVVAFGAVGAVSLIAKKRFNYEVAGDVKLYLLGVFAFLAGFIPADLGFFLLNNIKEAVGVAVGITALNTVLNKLNPNTK